jgi:hypothetical protein
MFGRKVIKRCPQGHEMDPTWRRCPKCTGGRTAAHEGRDITEMTVVSGPTAPALDETRVSAPAAARSLAAPHPARPPEPPRPSAPAVPAAPVPVAPAVALPPPSAPALPPAAPVAPRPAAAPAALRFTGGPWAGQTRELEPGVYKVGKAPHAGPDTRALAIPEDRYMSKDHATLTVGVASIVLTDPGSTNGTSVNGQKTSRAILQDGDEVRMGETVFKVSMRGGA